MGFGSSVGCDSVVAVVVVVIVTRCGGSGLCFGVRRSCLGVGGRLCVGSGTGFGVWGLGLCWPILEAMLAHLGAMVPHLGAILAHLGGDVAPC